MHIKRIKSAKELPNDIYHYYYQGDPDLAVQTYIRRFNVTPDEIMVTDTDLVIIPAPSNFRNKWIRED